MKKKLPIILIILIFTAGIILLLYPTVSDILSRMTSTAVIAQYQSEVKGIEEAEMDAMIAAAEQYNKNLPEILTMDPFGTSSKEPYKEDQEYNRLLSLDGIIGYVDVPKVDIYLPVYHGTSEDTLQKGVGHLYGSALPVGGEGSHSVVSAHRGLPAAKLFTDLDQIETGDVFYFHVLNRILAYQVDQVAVVDPTALEHLNPVSGKDYMTLFTCTPYGVNSHRLLIRGVRIPYEITGADGIAEAIAPPKTEAALPQWITFFFTGAAAIALVILATAFAVWKRKKKKGNETGGNS